MNTRLTTTLCRHCLIPIVVVALVAASTGCASRGHLRGRDTSTSLSTAANQVEAARQQLGAASAALSNLVNQPAVDLRGAFERYRASVDALERTVNAMNAEAENMQRNREQYFANWNQQLGEMQNENIRARSAARQQEVAQQFNTIQQQYAAVRQQFPSLLSRLRDIQRLVSVDLTPTGVRTAQDFASATEGDAATLRQTLDQLAASYRSVSSILSPGTPSS